MSRKLPALCLTLLVELDGSFSVVVADKHPTALRPVGHDADDDVDGLRLQLRYRDGHDARVAPTQQGPNQSADSHHLSQRSQSSAEAPRRVDVFLQQRRAIVDQEGGSSARPWCAQVGLVFATSVRQLFRQALAVLRRQSAEYLHNGQVGLCHDGDAHASDGGAILRRRNVGSEHSPTSFQILLHDLGLAHGLKLPKEGDGPQERGQNRMRKMQHELFGAAERGCLCAGKIGEPMQEVEAEVGGGRAGHKHGLESAQHRARRGFRLHEPPVVEAELALRELHRALLLFVEAVEGREQLWKMVHDVAQCMVVVANGVARAVPMVAPVLRGHGREKRLHLHDVVDGRQCEQRPNPVTIHGHLPGPAFHNQARVHEKGVEPVPLAFAEELEALLRGVQAVLVLVRRNGPVPLIDAKTKSVAAVAVETQQPVDGEKRADGALVLVTDCPPRACAACSTGA
mmetsp:Transcript_2288/g.6734  ORF Transcript_2288/g.6734 Transcript_2288/m.6734 type:complete len:456 (-) Transcript_2288:907-2274(-)